MKKLYDKTGREVFPGDILKVYHFTGSRRKRYYMYKLVLKRHEDNEDFFVISHLNLREETFNYKCEDKVDTDIEIVQGYAGVPPGWSYEDRPKIKV